MGEGPVSCRFGPWCTASRRARPPSRSLPSHVRRLRCTISSACTAARGACSVGRGIWTVGSERKCVSLTLLAPWLQARCCLLWSSTCRPTSIAVCSMPRSRYRRTPSPGSIGRRNRAAARAMPSNLSSWCRSISTQASETCHSARRPQAWARTVGGRRCATGGAMAPHILAARARARRRAAASRIRAGARLGARTPTQRARLGLLRVVLSGVQHGAQRS